MVLQVHDELVFDVLRSELAQVKEIVRHEMENGIMGFGNPGDIQLQNAISIR